MGELLKDMQGRQGSGRAVESKKEMIGGKEYIKSQSTNGV